MWAFAYVAALLLTCTRIESRREGGIVSDLR